MIPQLSRRPVKEHADAVRGLVSDMIAEWPKVEAFSPRPSLHLCR